MTQSLESSIGDHKKNVPDEFICPISHDIMRHPVMVLSSTSSMNSKAYDDSNDQDTAANTNIVINFDRNAILQWLCQAGNTCPITRRPLNVTDLVSNHALQGRIQAWRHSQALDRDENDGDDQLASIRTNEIHTDEEEAAPILLTCIQFPTGKNALRKASNSKSTKQRSSSSAAASAHSHQSRWGSIVFRRKR